MGDVWIGKTAGDISSMVIQCCPAVWGDRLQAISGHRLMLEGGIMPGDPLTQTDV